MFARDGLRSRLAADGPGRLAFGILGAAQELTGLTELEDHRRAAEVADLAGGNLYPLHVRLGRPQLLLERIVELVEHLDHVGLGGGDLVELALHVGGELQVEDLGKLFDQQVVDGHPEVRRAEPPFLLIDVAAVLDRLDDRCIGAGAADRLFFQGLDQRGLAVSRRRLGEVLRRVEAVEVEGLATERAGKSWSSCLPCWGHTRRCPSNFWILPCALKSPLPAVIDHVGDHVDGGAIWLARNRL